jgi:phage regulator Rha-like protein
MKALNVNRNSTNSVRLATKHAILTIVVNVHSLSSMRDVAKALGIHHKNVLETISRCKVMDDSGFALWFLFVKKKGLMGCLSC